MKKKYKIISEDVQKSLIEFLDEIQFDAASEGDKDSMHKVNFCNWAISELLNGYDAYVKPKKKSRDDYIEETFLDWNLPEMDDEEFEKLVDQFDGFLKAWEKEYNKKSPKKKSIKKRNTFKRPDVEDISQYMSLDEIKEYLLDDPELTDDERFELYYDEYLKTKERENKVSYEDMLKSLGLDLPPNKN
tara:strand:- start:39 stop:602 length:564 start_codon:yes stop_codon:yes gene_type:complete